MVDGTHLHHDARQRLGARRARRPRALALLLEDARRHPHRQSRARHVEQLPLHGDARQLPGVARREDRQGALAQGHRRLQPAVLLDDRRRSSSAITCIAGTGNDLDAPGFLQSFDPETGELQWKLYTVPMNPGDPGLDTWPSLDAARHGGAQPWMPGAYDPETKLYIFGTGNPTPAYTAGPRRRGQPLHLLARRGERRHRQDGLVLPDVAARHARLGFGADADPLRCDVQRQDAQARVDRRAQRLLLHARSRHRRARRDRASTARRRTG